MKKNEEMRQIIEIRKLIYKQAVADLVAVYENYIVALERQITEIKAKDENKK